MTDIINDANVFTGGCACGAVRYEIKAAPFYMGHCQCRKCQHMTGTGHSSMMAFQKAAMSVTGEVARWGFVADSGQTTIRHFCPTCGSPVFSSAALRADVVAVNAGGLDDPARFKPEAVVYTERGCAWDYLDPALPRYPTMPTGEIMTRT